MREKVIAALALLGFLLLPFQVIGQDKDSSDKAWPSLRSAEKIIDQDRLRFNIDPRKLEIAQDVSNPLSLPLCSPPSEKCRDWVHIKDFFSEWRGLWDLEKSILRPDVIMHHYPNALFGGHNYATGTWVFYLLKHKVFYLFGDCGMNHWDRVAGPFAGDPRLVLKKLAEESAAK